MSLEAAVEELDKTIRTIIGDEHVPDAATPILERQAESYDADRRTLAERIVDHLAASRCPLDALAISQAIGVENINVVRTTLSKLHLQGAINRPRPGTYEWLAPAGDAAPAIAGSPSSLSTSGEPSPKTGKPR